MITPMPKKSIMNRQIRKIDMKAIDFATVIEQLIDDAELKTNAVKNVTPILNKKINKQPKR
jgi:hypothetical protein